MGPVHVPVGSTAGILAGVCQHVVQREGFVSVTCDRIMLRTGLTTAVGFWRRKPGIEGYAVRFTIYAAKWGWF